MKGYYVIDYMTGAVLAASNENERLEPASITLAHVGVRRVPGAEGGRIKLDDMVTVSAHARDQDGSRMFIEVGERVSVENLIQGMIVQSGNDATVALAEHVAGSEAVFVDLMNQYAQKLGMTGLALREQPRDARRAALHDGTRHRPALGSARARVSEYYKVVPRNANSPGTRSSGAEPQRSAGSRSHDRWPEDGPYRIRRLLPVSSGKRRLACA